MLDFNDPIKKNGTKDLTIKASWSKLTRTYEMTERHFSVYEQRKASIDDGCRAELNPGGQIKLPTGVDFRG